LKIFILIIGDEFISAHKTFESARTAEYFEGREYPAEQWSDTHDGLWLLHDAVWYSIKEVELEE
jgi:hypothetical protein